MNIGDKVKILECHKIPELVGQEAEVVGMTTQELATYPVIVKLTSGDNEGKFCGFREDELEPVTPDHDIPDAFKEE